jgi:hypothetical protein
MNLTSKNIITTANIYTIYKIPSRFSLHYLTNSMEQPKVTAKWLVFLLRIWEIPGSNSAPETGYPD